MNNNIKFYIMWIVVLLICFSLELFVIVNGANIFARAGIVLEVVCICGCIGLIVKEVLNNKKNSIKTSSI